MTLREILAFPFGQRPKGSQHDKARPRSHRLGVINARSGRFVAVSSNGIKVAKFDMVEDNVQKTSFSCSSARLGADAKSAVSDALSEHGIQSVLTNPPLASWLNRSKCSK